MKKYCVKCGQQFIATGREVICPVCKAAAAEETKRAAVLKAKRASWAGESVPVRISGRASTIIRECGAVHGLPFAQALDELLKSTVFFQSTGKTWEGVTPYKSRRRDKATSTTEATSTMEPPQEVKQAADKPQDAPQEAKTTSKATSSKATSSKASKATSKK